MTSFELDKLKGKIGEDIFREDFLDFLNIKYKDVTGMQKFQIIDTDYLTSIGSYEIKTNYKDDNILCFEEYTNFNKRYGKISLGWTYKTNADLIVFISKKSRTMVFLPFNERFKKHYKYIRDNTKMLPNRVSTRDGRQWQSSFRKVPFNMLNGYISVYKKLKEATK